MQLSLKMSKYNKIKTAFAFIAQKTFISTAWWNWSSNLLAKCNNVYFQRFSQNLWWPVKVRTRNETFPPFFIIPPNPFTFRRKKGEKESLLNSGNGMVWNGVEEFFSFFLKSFFFHSSHFWRQAQKGNSFNVLSNTFEN